MLLEVRDLWVSVEGRLVVKGVNLRVRRGEVHVIMGPNAAGKSSLLSSIAGLRRYKIVKGRIIFEGKDVTDLPPHERAKLGIALAHQIPPKIKGVKVKDLIKGLELKYGSKNLNELADVLRVNELMGRYLFVDMSGGERKRLELFITALQKPKLALLDEPDSGVDVDSLDGMARAIEFMVSDGAAVVLVTHTGYILSKLKYRVNIDYAHVMVDGKIVYSGLPDEVIDTVMRYGYENALRKFKVLG